MVFVNTSLDVAQQRNAARERKLKRSLVKDIWTDVQKNLGAFQNIFGKNFVIIDNSDDTRSKTKPGRLDLVPHVLKATARFISTPIRNPIGKKWINMMMAHDKMTKSGDKRNRVTEQLITEIDNAILPADLERYLSRTIYIIEKFNLSPQRNLAVLARLVESLELDSDEFTRFYVKIKSEKFN